MRSFRGLVLLCLAVVALVPVSLVVGAKVTSAAEILDAFPAALAIARGQLSPTEAGPLAETAGIVATMRLPRTVLALVVGVALGAAGTLMQALTRNPLADTGTLGISSGAALMVTAGVYVWGISSPAVTMWLALAGAGLTAVVVFLIARSVNPLTLVLAGAALAATLGAMTSGIIYIDPQALDALRFWQAGAVGGRGFDVIGPASLLIGVGTVVALSVGPALNVLSLGSETATAMGANVVRVNLVGYVALTLLAGAATAAAGPIAFVGLVAPHIVRVFTGPDYRWMLPLSAIAGAGMLLLADIVGQVVLRPGELQAGIVVALVGAPCFVWLVRRRKLVAL